MPRAAGTSGPKASSSAEDTLPLQRGQSTSLRAIAPLRPHHLHPGVLGSLGTSGTPQSPPGLAIPSPPAPDTAHLPPLIQHVDAETARAEACSTSCVFVECLKAKSHSPFPKKRADPAAPSSSPRAPSPSVHTLLRQLTALGSFMVPNLNLFPGLLNPPRSLLPADTRGNNPLLSSWLPSHIGQSVGSMPPACPL